MSQKNQIQIFNDRKVRTIWDSDKEEWYFSVVDVVVVLTDSVDPKQYIKKMRSRDPELNSNWGTICTLVPMIGADGKRRKTMAADSKGLFRIIQSIPSPKAEPFKQWMAQVAATRLDQMQDPELSIEQAVTDYRRLGYSEEWINQRLRGIEVRKMLTDEWKRGGLDDSKYGLLTDFITRQWSGIRTREYKDLKGLKKESLRDNMTNIELALNTLAEASAVWKYPNSRILRLSDSISMLPKVVEMLRKWLEQNWSINLEELSFPRPRLPIISKVKNHLKRLNSTPYFCGCYSVGRFIYNYQFCFASVCKYPRSPIVEQSIIYWCLICVGWASVVCGLTGVRILM